MPKFDIVHEVKAINPSRSFNQLSRRIMKLGEELGELNEAYLAVTSEVNYKNKTWTDVREEAADAVIVSLDILLTATPDLVDLTPEEQEALVYEMVHAKLEKWRGLKQAISQQAKS